MKKTSLLPIALGLALSACQTMPKTEPIHGPTNPTPEDAAKVKVKYYGSIIELRPEKEKEYRELHANVWPEVRAAIAKANIRNFNIYVTEIAGKRLLVSHFEYTGTNPKADFASIGNDPTTKNKWWPITDAYQIRLPGTPKGSQWLGMSQGMQIVGGQILGFVSGEWKGAPSKALTLIFVAIGLLMAAAVILALANTLSS